MPTYDYKCLKCNKTFEIFQSMKDESLKNCPDCNGELKRLIGAGAGPIFKGSGFYQTDYKNSSKSSETKKSENVKPVDKSFTENKTNNKGTTEK
ncbi:MAG TPA: zinc ribbon domain-containing protein [Ignavibacteriaceae bacterium]